MTPTPTNHPETSEVHTTSKNPQPQPNPVSGGWHVVTALILVLLGINLGLSIWMVSQRKEAPAPERMPAQADSSVKERFDRLDSKLAEWNAKKPPAGVTDKLLGNLQDNVIKSIVPENQPKKAVKFSFSSIAILPFVMQPMPEGFVPGEGKVDPIKIKQSEKDIAAAPAGLASLLESDQRYRVVFPDKTGVPGKGESSLEVARKLGTEAFVTGEGIYHLYQPVGAPAQNTVFGINLHIALIEAKSGFSVWSSTYFLSASSASAFNFDDIAVRKNLGPVVLKIAEDLLPFAKAASDAPGKK